MKPNRFSKSIAALLAISITSSCATMNDSLQLGAALGMATGATAAAIGHTANTGSGAPFETIAIGAGIGLGVGLITSYFTHKAVEKERQGLHTDYTDMYFGDLPPSPFIVPKIPYKKGAR